MWGAGVSRHPSFNLFYDDLSIGLLLLVSQAVQHNYWWPLPWASPLFLRADIFNDDLCLGFSSLFFQSRHIEWRPLSGLLFLISQVFNIFNDDLCLGLLLLISQDKLDFTKRCPIPSKAGRMNKKHVLTVVFSNVRTHSCSKVQKHIHSFN